MHKKKTKKKTEFFFPKFACVYIKARQLAVSPLKRGEKRGRAHHNLGVRRCNMRVYGSQHLFKSLKLSSACAMFRDIQADVPAQA